MILHYPATLPIASLKDSIIEAVKNNQVVIVEGDTGSGKTTQLPKMCLEAFPEIKGLIGCTQPRRIAATSVAMRVADELGSSSHIVGYKIRFQDHTSSSNRIKFMTDGVLLAETRMDTMLSQYKVIIVDEAHERSLNIDFLLGYLKRLLPRRPDLKIVITSATIDTAAFSRHFGDAPVISVSGRSYPVTVKYQPPDTEDREVSEGIVDHCVKMVEELFTTRPEGDLLIFLATERDIRECCRLLENKFHSTTVLPLFGRLSASDQKKIFKTIPGIKIIVATNVAETSLTVPGIRYVIDSGFARISHYNSRAKTTSLPVTKISRASCDQRKGRCGRIGPGICLRLYSEEDYLNRSEFTVPELKRSNLAEVILQMISLDLGEPSVFPFIDPPSKNSIREGYRLLQELGAIDQKRRLTKRGRLMADLPIDPCISRIILEANQIGCLREIKIIASLLAIQDPKIRPAEKENEAVEAHKKFQHAQSDFMSYLNIWNGFHKEAGEEKSWSKLKKFCKTNFLSFQKMREWFDLQDQLGRLLSKRKGYADNVIDADYEQIHKALLTGFMRNLAKRKHGLLYNGSHNKELMIFPGSGQFDKKPPWILGASFIETNKLYALTVAAISPEWIEHAARHLCKYSWFEPHWQKKTGQVIASEAVSLFGLTVSAGKKVNFGRRNKKNIKEARDIFIMSALVKGEMNGSYRFLDTNLATLKKWGESEEKLRVRNIVADDLTIHTFYADRIPDDVYDQRTLNRFLKRKRNHSFLIMRDRDILQRDVDDNELVNFPTTKHIGSMELHLEYSFAPGSDKDGVTFRIPRGFAPVAPPDHFDWLVPGLLHEKVTYLLKSLPKSIRKKLVPISDSVNRIIDDLTPGNKPFLPALEQSILKQFNFQIHRSDWKTDLPDHLRPRFLLFDEEGRMCCSGRDLLALVDRMKETINVSDINSTHHSVKDEKIIARWEKSEHMIWDFSELPDEIISYTKNGEISGILYSALKPIRDKGKVCVSFLKDSEAARQLNQSGILFLIGLHYKDQYKSLRKLCSTTLSGPSTLLFLKLGKSRNELVDQAVEYILRHLVYPLPTKISDKHCFMEKIDTLGRKGLFKSGQKYLEQILSSLRKRREVEEQISHIFEKARGKGHYLPPVKNVFLNELSSILPIDFLFSEHPTDFLQIERQLRGLEIRIERFYVNPLKDELKARQLEPYLNKLKELKSRRGKLPEDASRELLLYQEMVDDYKLALFAPEIKGRKSVSSKKLDLQWQKALAKC